MAHPLSVRGRPDRRLARPDGRDHAARDDARRRGGRGESRRRALSASDRPARTSPARRARDPGHRRRVRGPGVRHGLPQDHARPRLQRLPGRPAARPAADRRPDARGEDQRKRAAELPRPRPLRGPQAHRGRPAVARIARIGQAAPHDRPEVRPDGRGGRADADRPVVRRDVEARALRDAVPGQVDRRGRAGGGRAGRGEVRTGQLGEHLQPVARQHPGLVHLAPALVGPPDPRLVRRRRPDLRRPRRSRGGRTGPRRRAHRHANPGPGRARHLVLVRARVPLHARLARAAGRGPAGLRALSPIVGSGHRLRDHLLLGRADGDDDDPFHRPGAVPRRVHPRHRPRPRRRENVEVRGQRHRPGGPHRRHRARSPPREADHRPASAGNRAARPRPDQARVPGGHPRLRGRCAPLHDGRVRHARPQRQLRLQALRGLSELLQQTVERDALRPHEHRGRGLRRGRVAYRRAVVRRSLDREPAAADRGRGREGFHRVPPRQRGERDLPLRVGRVLRLVSGARQGPSSRPGARPRSAARAARSCECSRRCCVSPIR